MPMLPPGPRMAVLMPITSLRKRPAVRWSCRVYRRISLVGSPDSCLAAGDAGAVSGADDADGHPCEIQAERVADMKMTTRRP